LKGSQPFRHPANWTFKDEGVAEGFDRHVREQLPWYDIVTSGVAFLVKHYLPERGRILDLGASTGNIGRKIADTLEVRKADLVAYDNSPQMGEMYRGGGKLIIEDIAGIEDFGRFDVATCMLTLMFLSVEARARVVSRLKARCAKGGAIIVVDRVQPEGGYLDQALYRLTLDGKLRSGATPQEIIDKELSLAGVQRPMCRTELEGFREWFRFGHFIGFIYEA
jgi:tRNA (cmo5U34)-methyltransferase